MHCTGLSCRYSQRPGRFRQAAVDTCCRRLSCRACSLRLRCLCHQRLLLLTPTTDHPCWSITAARSLDASHALACDSVHPMPFRGSYLIPNSYLRPCCPLPSTPLAVDAYNRSPVSVLTLLQSCLVALCRLPIFLRFCRLWPMLEIAAIQQTTCFGLPHCHNRVTYPVARSVPLSTFVVVVYCGSHLIGHNLCLIRHCRSCHRCHLQSVSIHSQPVSVYRGCVHLSLYAFRDSHLISLLMRARGISGTVGLLSLCSTVRLFWSATLLLLKRITLAMRSVAYCGSHLLGPPLL
jgi:hypothetical protein